MSIFRRAFPLKALEQGLGATREEWQSLVDWALLRYDPIEGNYRLHSLTARYSGDLLDAADRKTTQVQVAEWYLRYGREESHHLLRAAGEGERAGELVMNLGEVLSRFGLYELLRQLCILTITDTHNIQEGLTAQALHQLGIIAQKQGDYPEARRLYGESLTIDERLGDQGGRASTLGQLGLMARQQKDYQAAMRYILQALDIFERLRSPYRSLALQTLAQLRAEVGEATFAVLWQEASGGRPLPDLPGDADASTDEDADQDENGTEISLAEFPQHVAMVITQGTMPQRQQLAEQLSEVQVGLPLDAAVLAPLLACLVVALHGETPDTSSLEEPFTSLWQQFQDELKSQNRQQDQ